MNAKIKDNGFTPLMLAAWDDQHMIALEELTSNGADLDQKDKYNNPALNFALIEETRQALKLSYHYYLQTIFVKTPSNCESCG